MAGDVKKEIVFLNQDRPSISKFDEKTRKFTTSKTVNILNGSQLMSRNNQHQWQHYELFQQPEKLFSNKLISPILLHSASSSIEQTNTSLIFKSLERFNYYFFVFLVIIIKINLAQWKMKVLVKNFDH